ncbi:unnamed protein product [Amaranthus hypochondriacus]
MQSIPIASGTNGDHQAIISSLNLNENSKFVPNPNLYKGPDNGSKLHQSSDSMEALEDIVDDEISEWVDEGNEEVDDRISLGLVGKLWEGPTENPIIEAAISHGPLKPDGTEASVQKNKVQVGYLSPCMIIFGVRISEKKLKEL